MGGYFVCRNYGAVQRKNKSGDKRMELGRYWFEGQLNNEIHDISEEQIVEWAEMTEKEDIENETITKANLSGSSLNPKMPFEAAILQDILRTDRKTSGAIGQYPHGVFIRQAMNRDYYRGEGCIYLSSSASFFRDVEKRDSPDIIEIKRLIADMRIAEFSALIHKFEHVKKWGQYFVKTDVFEDILAQHYGLHTCWLDITSSFKTALFFACCKLDEDGKWRPKNQKDFDAPANPKYEKDRKHGMIFHMPSWAMTMRWNMECQKFAELGDKLPENLIYPIGFQPFMRCSMQNGYAIYMRKESSLYDDNQFEKLRFRHSEKLSNWIFEEMKEGELIYPHEGLEAAGDIIKEISLLNEFSEEAFQYALKRSHKYFSKEDEKECRKVLGRYKINGKKIQICKYSKVHLSNAKYKHISEAYKNFSPETEYGITIGGRRNIAADGSPAGANMYEPYMLTDDLNERGLRDFKPRKMAGVTSIWTETMASSLWTLMSRNADDFGPI